MNKYLTLICFALSLWSCLPPKPKVDQESLKIAILEGKIYKEPSSSAVFIIYDGKKILIPTPDALHALGFEWNQLTTVPDGTLSRFPLCEIRG